MINGQTLLEDINSAKRRKEQEIRKELLLFAPSSSQRGEKKME